MSELLQLFLFYTTLTALGFLAYTIFKNIYKDFADLGYAFSKIIGVLVLAYISWILKYFFKNEFISQYALILTLTICGVIILKLKVYRLKLNKTIVLTEGIFLLAFIAMLLFRASTPKIEGIEKFMDYAIINSLSREQTISPTDVWFSGEHINYYYFGHYIFSTLFKMSGVEANVGYNLAVAFIFATVVTEAFALVLFLTKKRKYALFGAALLSVGGNLDYLHNLLFVRTHTYFYAEARSLIPNTINEFPAYSFLIGDLHAHIMDIPFVLLFLSFIVALINNKELIKNKLFVLILALSFGALAGINSWDLFIYAPVLVTALAYVFFVTKAKFVKSSLYIIGLLLFSFCLFLPMYLYFKPAVGGIGLFNFTLDASAIIRMFGFYFLIFLPFYLYALVKRKRVDFKTGFIFLMLSYAMVLIIIPEFMFIKDIYFKLNPPYFRANTIFKIWYQAWIILSLFSPVALLLVVPNIKHKILRFIYKMVIFLLSLFIFGSTFSAVKYIVGPTYIYKGLDGTTYLNETLPDAKKAIDWLNTNVRGQAVLLETQGDSYTMGSLVSSYTGLTTPVGWSSHELGWRDNWPEIANRMGDIEMMYKNDDRTLELLQKYQVKYILIGQDELDKYGDSAGTKIAQYATEVAKFGNYRILRVNQ